eukprot:Hpha_TRINITY_DN16889_c5_g2::TRINITY_DN16889_c5_g2_i1::g.148310::m.148310
MPRVLFIVAVCLSWALPGDGSSPSPVSPPVTPDARALLRAHRAALAAINTSTSGDVFAQRHHALSDYIRNAAPEETGGSWGWAGGALFDIAEEASDMCAHGALPAQLCASWVEEVVRVDLRCAKYSRELQRSPGAPSGGTPALCHAPELKASRVYFPETGPGAAAGGHTRVLLLNGARFGVAATGHTHWDVGAKQRRAHPLFPHESPTGWVPKEVPHQGVMKILVLATDFSDEPGWPKNSKGIDIHQAGLYEKVYGKDGDLDLFLRDNSGSKLRTEVYVAPELYRAPYPSRYYSENGGIYLDELLPNVLEQATANGHPRDDYDNWVVATTYLAHCDYGGLALMGYAGAHSNAGESLYTMGHEFGHNLGRGHAKTKEPMYEYGNKLSIMGASGGNPNPHYGTNAKVGYGWVDPISGVIDAGALSQTYRLYRHDHQNATGERAIRMGWDWHYRYFWLEYRFYCGFQCSGCQTGQYPWASDTPQYPLVLGVVITEEQGDPAEAIVDHDDSQLIDATPSTPITSSGKSLVDVTIPVGGSYTLYGDGGTSGDKYATIEVLSAGGTSPNEYLDVKIDYVRDACPFPSRGEHPPCGDRCVFRQHSTTGSKTATMPFSEFAVDFEIPMGKSVSGLASLSVAGRGAVLTGADIKVYRDSGGKPTGDPIAQGTISGVSISVNDDGEYTINIPVTNSLAQISFSAGLYWISVRPSWSGTWKVNVLDFSKGVSSYPHGTPTMVKSGADWTEMDIFTKICEVTAVVQFHCTTQSVQAASAVFKIQPPAKVNVLEEFQVEVRFLDVNGVPVVLPEGTLVDLEFGTNPGQGHLPDSHLQKADGYSRFFLFTVTIDHGGTGYTLTCVADGLTVTATSSAFEVEAGAVTGGFSLAFDSSGFFKKPGETGLVVEEEVPLAAVKIQVLDSHGAADTTSAGLQITASSDVALAGTTTVAVDSLGIATFSNVMFAGCDAAASSHAITFTADATSSLAVAGKTLKSGGLTVNGRPVGGMRFASQGSLFNAPGALATVTEGSPMSPTKLELLDSCGGLDTSGTGGVQVTATVSDGTLTGSTTTFNAQGVATFDQLTFSAAPATGTTTMTFSAVSQGNPIDGKQLATGDVTVNAKSKPAFALGLSPNSPYGATSDVQAGSAFTLSLWLLDERGSHDVVTSGVSVSCASPSGAEFAGGLAVQGDFNAGVVDLSVTLVPPAGGSCGTVTLTCTASAQGLDVDGKQITTAGITLTGAPAASARLQTTLPTSITTGSPFDDLSFQLLDSCGNVDTVTEGLDIYLVKAVGNPEMRAKSGACAEVGGLPCAEFHGGQAVLQGLEVVVPPCPSAPIELSFSVVNLTVAAGSFGAVGKEAVKGSVTLQAKSYARLVFEDSGSLSFLTEANKDETVDGTVLPAVRVRVLNGCDQNAATPVPHVEVTVAAVDNSPGGANQPIQLTGAKVSLDDAGVAEFPHITFDTCPQGRPVLTFSIKEQGEMPAMTVVSGYITTNPKPGAIIQFSHREATFFTDEHHHRTVIKGVALPKIVIRSADVCGTEDTAAGAPKGISIKATAPHVELSGNVVPLNDGVAEFSSLTFVTGFDADVKITFVTEPASPPGMSVTQLVTGLITVGNSTLPAANMFFQSTGSFMVREYQDAAVALDEKLLTANGEPIVIELQDSANQLDTVTTGVTVEVTTNSGVLQGTSCTVVAGFCKLSDLAFTGCPDGDVELVFTAKAPGLDIDEQYLRSGKVNVSGIPNSALAFAPTGSYFTQAGQERSVSLHVTLPSTSVEVVDSCGRATHDHNLDGLKIRVSGGVKSSGLQAIVSSGIGEFSSMIFDTEPYTNPTILNFSMTLPSGKTLSVVTGNVEVHNDAEPSANIQFSVNASLSAITAEGAQLDVGMKSKALPAIVLEVQDSMGYLDSTDSVTVVTVSASAGDLRTAGTSATAVNGFVTFDQLVFESCHGGASPGVTLVFTATNVGKGVDGMSIKTGQVRVSGEGGVEIRFSGFEYTDVGTADAKLDSTHEHPVAVESFDSCGFADGLAGWSATLSGFIPPPAVPLSCEAVKGRCTVKLTEADLTPYNGGNFTLTFTTAAAARLSINGASVVSGTVSILGPEPPTSSPSNSPSSVPSVPPSLSPSENGDTSTPSTSPSVASSPSISPSVSPSQVGATSPPSSSPKPPSESPSLSPSGKGATSPPSSSPKPPSESPSLSPSGKGATSPP